MAKMTQTLMHKCLDKWWTSKNTSVWEKTHPKALVPDEFNLPDKNLQESNLALDEESLYCRQYF